MADARWYVVHVYSGFENKVAESIREKAAKVGLEDAFEEILVLFNISSQKNKQAFNSLQKRSSLI